jgi:hypothetical protein
MQMTGWLKVVVAISVTVACGAAVYQELSAKEAELVSYIPAETDEVLANPYMGFAVNAESKGVEQPFRLTHANLTWRELEPQMGQIVFEETEQRIQLERWRRENVKVILRIILDYPSKTRHMDIPDWLYESINHRGNWYDTEFGKGFSPDYSNPDLIRYHERLIRALGERYNDDPAIAFIQLGSLGHWGEWHTWEDGTERIPFPLRETADQYAKPYIEAFPNKPLMMRRPHAIALRSGMGLFNDAFGRTDATVEEFLRWYTEGYTSWLTKEEEPAMPDFWIKAPSGGEFAEETAYFSDDRIDETIRQAKLTHVSYMGPHAPYRQKKGGPLQENIDRFLNTIGYRFVIVKDTHEKTIQSGESLKVTLRILNRGVAPFYFNWPLELTLTDRAGNITASFRTEADIRDWLPGESETSATLPLPEGLPKGIYRLNAAILDPETGLPGIEFANSGKRSDGRYPLGTVEVK